jgi:hypothetical protein
MSCMNQPLITELDFVIALNRRGLREACTGPLVTIEMDYSRAFTIERICHSRIASRIFWGGLAVDTADQLTFVACAAHWLDLACLMWMRAAQQRRPDAQGEADQLLRDLCAPLRWDPKEIVNMFQWRRLG